MRHAQEESALENVTDVPCVSKERVEIEADHVAPDPKSGRAGIIVALLCTWVVWGSTYLAMRIGLEGFPPFLMAAIRFLISGVLLYAILRVRGAPHPTAAQWGGALLVGALLLGGGNGGVVFAEQWVTSGLAALGVATVPLWAALFAGLWGQWPSRREWMGLALGFAGMILLSLDGDLRAKPLGLIALLISALCWAFGSVWSRRLPQPPGIMASAAQMFCGGIVLVAAGLAHGEHMSHLPAARPLLAMVYLVFGAIVGFSAYVYLLKRVRPALATSNSYVNPVIAVALGALLAGERLTPSGVGALCLILAGVALVALTKQN